MLRPRLHKPPPRGTIDAMWRKSCNILITLTEDLALQQADILEPVALGASNAIGNYLPAGWFSYPARLGMFLLL